MDRIVRIKLVQALAVLFASGCSYGMACSDVTGAKQADAPALTGWARMPAATFSDGPTSGQFASPNAYGIHMPPYQDLQPVQGFSAVLALPWKDSFLFLVDNGFGAQTNSADALLRAYSLRIQWRSAAGGAGTIVPIDRRSGVERPVFDGRTTLQLNDARGKLTLAVQADHTHYYDEPTNPRVDPVIRAGRLLTGADFDIESFQRDRDGNFWFGDEFGPYLIRTDADGTVLRNEIPLAGVYAPQHKDVAARDATANLPGSGGFEGMAINPRGTMLYALLERPVTGDRDKTLRMYEFDLVRESYTGRYFLYGLDASGTNIGDMVAIDDHRFIVLERNGSTATSPASEPAPFKKVFLIDIEGVGEGGEVHKSELVDLMNLADPHDLDGDGSRTFAFPYVTVEDVLILDERTLLVVNDNNFPYGGGRELAPDDTEFLRIQLPVLLYAVENPRP